MASEKTGMPSQRLSAPMAGHLYMQTGQRQLDFPDDDN